MGSALKIRNIIQSAQEREIVKTAPDMVVYIESLPFIRNPYLGQDDNDIVIVNFNDFISAVSITYSIDSFMPTGSIHLNVPNGMKHLFMAPGGGLIFDLMTSIRIYSKSYFFSDKGNTVYRRIFQGLIKSIDLSETTTGLDMTISIVGICRLLEIAQIELKKSLMSPSSTAITWARTSQSTLSIYQAIYATFDAAMDFSEFITSSFLQDSIKGGDVGKAIQQEYITRWALRLQDMRRDLRIFGAREYKDIKDTITNTPPGYKKEDDAVGTKAIVGSKSESQTEKDNAVIIDKIKQYHFDMTTGGIQLFGNNLVPRIERIRALVDMAGMEGYQDVDGTIIIKPPLYNLDCTVLGPSSTGDKDLLDENLYEQANPFIVHLAEVITESYLEDETAIRRTAMTLAPNFGSPSGYQFEGQINKSQVIRYVDINLVRKFGVRDEQPKYFGFLTKDKMANYGFAVCELNKANRNFRTYHVTIPLRPEIRLGFPIYLPHKDIYAYVTGVAISYTVGSQATMSLTCNYVRKRPLFKQKQTITTEAGKDLTQDQAGPPSPRPTTSTVTVYASQPNLVHAWTTKNKNNGVVQTKADQNGKLLKLVGSPSSISAMLPSETVTKEQKAVEDYKTKKLANTWETWVSEFDGACWRIQNDDAENPLPLKHGVGIEQGPFWYNGTMDKDTGIRTVPKRCDLNYLRRSTVVQPYTDEKGYEVIPLFPWGRYSTLREAIVDCTRNYWYKGSSDAKEAIQEDLKKTSGFLMAGLAIPGSTPAGILQDNLNRAQSEVNLANDNLAMMDAMGGGASSTAQTVASQQALDTAKAAQKNSLGGVLPLFAKFDKSNVISFELDFKSDDLGNPKDNVPDQTIDLQDSGVGDGFGDTTDKAVPQEGSPKWQDKMTAFLQGFLGPTGGTGPYAVDLRPQNTDIGGYRPPSGPLSGVLLSMAATFASSPYGQLFGLGPKKKTTWDPSKQYGGYFSSGYEDKRNIS